MRRGDDREAAAAALGQQDVEILPGLEIEWLGGGQLQVHREHIVSQRHDALDAARQALDERFLGHGRLEGLDR